MDIQEKKVIEETAKKLLNVLGVDAPFQLNETEEGIELLLETEENGMLIGYHGETLEALQLILALSVAKTLGRFVRISVEVGEYKKKRMEYLQQLVAQAREQVVSEKVAVPLPNLKSWERRFVHMLVKDDTELTSESTGEGRDRMLTLYPKQ